MRNWERYKQEEQQNYMDSLATAHIAAQEALNALYRPGGIKRNFWTRWRLGRAQSILISMYVDEKRKEDRSN